MERAALIFALLAQAMIFGLVHAYQGPTEIAGSAISGPVFGVITIADRFRHLLKVLQGRGWSEANLKRLLGQNWLRLFADTIS